jgi:hypothetical protein
MDTPTVTIPISRYEELLKNENALKSNKKVVLIRSYDGYVSGKIAVDNEAWEEVRERLKDEVTDLWETLNASKEDPKEKSISSIFSTIVRCK